MHPRTNTPKSFESDVKKIDDGGEQAICISMNEPLRHEGLVLFQSDWWPKGLPDDQRVQSIFSVVRNPSDNWPAISCGIIFLGMAIAFGMKLVKYVMSQSAARQRTPAEST